MQPIPMRPSHKSAMIANMRDLGSLLFGYTSHDLELAAIFVPPPEDETNEHGEYEDWFENLEERATVQQFWAQQHVNSGAEDPLLASLDGLRRHRNEIEQQMILLVAYMRERIKPRPYTLQQIADAVGLSVSGTRTFYAAEDLEALDRRIAYAKQFIANHHASRGTAPGRPSIPVLPPEAEATYTQSEDGTLARVTLHGDRGGATSGLDRLKTRQAARTGMAWTWEEYESLAEMLRAGANVPDISRDLDRTPGAVKAVLRKFIPAGTEIPARHRVEFVRALVSDGTDEWERVVHTNLALGGIAAWSAEETEYARTAWDARTPIGEVSAHLGCNELLAAELFRNLNLAPSVVDVEARLGGADPLGPLAIRCRAINDRGALT